MKRDRRPVSNPSLAIAYLRGSRDSQKLTPDAQRTAIEAFAAAEGLTICAWHVEAVSGGADVDDRPVLLAAIDDLRVHGAGTLLVAKRDRLARDGDIAGFLSYSLRKAGARIMSADGANGEDLNDRMTRTLQAMFAEQERHEIRRRTRAALAVLKARGVYLGAPPFGYRRDGAGLVEDAAEQGVLRIVRELRAAGLSQRAIVAELAKRGAVSRVGRPFQATQIARMLAA